MSGEEVTYQYDQLGRMIAASTTGPEWGQSFTFDGFGNLTQQTVTKGTAPSMSIAVDQSTNRLVDSNISYDAAGNMHFYISNVTRSMTYDSLNRVSRVERHDYATESYLYSARNERMVVKRKNTWPLNSWEDPDEVHFYDITGVLIGVYQIEKAPNDNYYGAYYPIRIDERERVYFGGRLILTGSRDGGVQLATYTDRLGSVVRSGTTNYRYYPYGQEIGGATANDTPKFGTYTRDSWSGLDYAMNRYYYSAWGRFTSPDPYQASGGVADPGSWNRYAYVGGDPVNFNDPAGLALNYIGSDSGLCAPGYTNEEGSLLYVPCDAYVFKDSLTPQVDPSERPRHSLLLDVPLTRIPHMKEAGGLALEALKRDDCAKLFNTRTSNVALGPRELLLDLLSGSSSYGRIDVGNLGGADSRGITSASTVGVLGRSPQGTSIFIRADITININSGSPWMTGYPDRFNIQSSAQSSTQSIYRAITLIHELGHLFGIVTGLGGSQILPDGYTDDPTGATSRNNTDMVFRNCFK